MTHLTSKMNVQVSQQKIRSLKRFVQNTDSKQHYSSVSPNVKAWRIAYLTSSTLTTYVDPFSSDRTSVSGMEKCIFYCKITRL